MTIVIADNSPRISYVATQGQTVFTIPFEFFDDTDINLYINDVLKTITTDYTVTGGDGSKGTVTLVTGATAGDAVVITRDVTLERVTDFPTSGQFQVAALNIELDKLVAMVADLKDLANRGLRLSDSDLTASLTLASPDDRKGTVLAFNATTGDAEVGPTIADISTVATNASAAASSATAAASSAVSASNSAAAAAAAFDSFDDTYLGSFSSDPTTDNDGNPLVEGALYFNGPANEMRVYDGANWIAATSAGTATMRTYKYTATASQTTFSGSDDSGSTLSYSINNLIVTLNGLVLEDGSDYTATNGTSIVLTVAASVNDELNIIAFNSFVVGEVSVDSVNGQQGIVVLDADDISDASTTNKYTTAADISKLAGIETGATADQTPAEIKSAYESNADTNEFSDAEQSKLAGIETNATADQTAAEIKTAYESNADTNEFSDAEKSKLAGIAAGAEVNLVDSVNTQTGAVVLDADDISDAATTNKFTTAGDISKLAGIEALADVTDATNVAAAGAAMLTGATFTGNVSFGDSNKAIFGSGSDLEIFHDGSNSIISDLGTGDLIIKGSNNIYLKDANDEIVMRAGTAIGARLYYGNSLERLRTTASGIFIYGDVESQSGTVDGELIAKSYNETYVALSGTTPTVDCHNGNMFSLTTSGNTTFTFSNPPASGTAFGFTLKLVAGGTHTITYPASVDWAGGSAPDAPASGETDVLVFITHDGGTTWYGFRSGDAMA